MVSSKFKLFFFLNNMIPPHSNLLPADQSNSNPKARAKMLTISAPLDVEGDDGHLILNSRVCFQEYPWARQDLV